MRKKEKIIKVVKINSPLLINKKARQADRYFLFSWYEKHLNAFALHTP
jgi:hypothetical protein